MRQVQALLAVVVLALGVGACGNKAETDGGGGGGGEAASWPQRDVRIMAPADPGGGWDSTARAMAEAMRKGKVIDKGVEVYNVPAAGGTIGLSQLASKRAGDSNELMVMGLVMLGAILTNDSPVDLSKTTPIAALTTEPEAIVVRSQSEYKSMQDLVDAMKADPGKVSFGGGSAGGTDQILVGLVAKAVGVDPSKPKYVAYSGGGEAVQSILSGSVDAGVSGVSEFADHVEAGKMRVLAVSTRDSLEVGGKEAKSLTEQDIDVEITNWRGVVAPPEIKPAEREAIIAAIEKLHDSPEWQQALESNEWTDFFRTGDEFQAFIDSENKRVEQVLRDIGLTE
jgi:putative tricarboxylic transport membrane protein